MAAKKVLKESDKKGYATDPDRVNIKNYDIDKQKPAPKALAKPAPSEISKEQANLTKLTNRLGNQSQPSKPMQPAQSMQPAQPVKLNNVPTGGSDGGEMYEGSKYKKGGAVKSSASSRGDGCAQRGKTRGKWV